MAACANPIARRPNRCHAAGKAASRPRGAAAGTLAEARQARAEGRSQDRCPNVPKAEPKTSWSRRVDPRRTSRPVKSSRTARPRVRVGLLAMKNELAELHAAPPPYS